MALIDFTLSNARRFYSSVGNPLGWKGLSERMGHLQVSHYLIKNFYQTCWALMEKMKEIC